MIKHDKLYNTCLLRRDSIFPLIVLAKPEDMNLVRVAICDNAEPFIG